MDRVRLMLLTFGVAVVLGVPVAFCLILATTPPILMEPRLAEVLLAQRIYNSLDGFVLSAAPFFLLAGNPMIAASQFVYIAIWCRRLGVLAIRTMAPTAARSATFMSAAPGMAFPVILIGSIIFGIETPTEASILAVACALFIGFAAYKESFLRQFRQELVSSAKLVSLSLFCLSAVGLFAWLLNYYGVPQAISGMLEGIASPFLLLADIALVCLGLGMFLDALVIITVIGPLFLPAVAAAGLDPTQYGIVACVSLSLGLVTLPNWLCPPIASALAEIGMHEAFGEMAKIFAGMLIVVLLLTLVPQLTTLPPAFIR